MSDRDSGSGDSPRRGRRSSKSRSRSRSPRKSRVLSKRVVIANIPFDVSWQKLKEIFREEVGYTGYLDMIEVNGKAIGMGVMEFRTFEGAEKAISKMHRYPLGDRKLVVREETSRDQERINQYKSGVDPHQMQQTMSMMMPQLLAQCGIEGPATPAIYISNLDYKVTWQKLKDVFRMAGHVLNVDVKTDKEGQSRGFAVIKFEHPYEALQAITMFNGQNLFDRQMRIKFDREAQIGGGPMGGHGGSSGPGNFGGPMGGPGLLSANSGGGNFNSGRGGGMMGNNNMPMGGNRGGNQGFRGGGRGGGGGGKLPDGLRSIGMGLGMDGQPLRSVQEFGMAGQGGMGGGNIGSRMGGGGGPMGGASLSGGNMGGGGANMGGSGGNMGGNLNGAMAGLQQLFAAAASGGMNQDQLLAVASAVGQGLLGGAVNDMNVGNGNMGGMQNPRGPDMMMGGGGMGGGGGGGMGGLMSNGRPRSDTVVVRNLPYSYTWQDLKRSFRDVGDVKNADIRTDPGGKSKGFGFVKFFNPNDAMKAVDMMNGARFDGRSVRVELDGQN